MSHRSHAPDGPRACGGILYAVDPTAANTAKEIRELLPSMFMKKPKKKRPRGRQRKAPDPKDFEW